MSKGNKNKADAKGEAPKNEVDHIKKGSSKQAKGKDAESPSRNDPPELKFSDDEVPKKSKDKKAKKKIAKEKTVQDQNSKDNSQDAESDVSNDDAHPKQHQQKGKDNFDTEQTNGERKRKKDKKKKRKREENKSEKSKEAVAVDQAGSEDDAKQQKVKSKKKSKNKKRKIVHTEDSDQSENDDRANEKPKNPKLHQNDQSKKQHQKTNDEESQKEAASVDKKNKKKKRKTENHEEPTVSNGDNNKEALNGKNKKKKKLKQEEEEETVNEDDDAKEKKNKEKKNVEEKSGKESSKPGDSTVTVEPEDVLERFPPIQKFSDEKSVPEWLLKAACNEFEKPTAIQAYSWRPALSKLDVIGIARTGSGKTLAFIVPAMILCLQSKSGASKQKHATPLALVLAPTRELAMQTARVATEISQSSPTPIRVCCLYGGVDKYNSRNELKNGADIVIATPGRLLDMCQERSLSLERVRYFVLDEADRMLDLGFEKEVKDIAAQVHGMQSGATKIKRNEQVQTLMFSATWPLSVRQMASEYLRKEEHVIKITISSGNTSSDGSGATEQGPAANTSITQHVIVLDDPRQKDRILLDLLQKLHAPKASKVGGQSSRDKIIVFCLYKKETERVYQFLLSRSYSCVALHGDMNQNDRTKSFESFRSGRIPLLIATDVAARGVDIPNVEAVINYTFPLTIEEYVHRIGRTGRAGKTGVSHTLFTSDEKRFAGALVNILRNAQQEIPKDLYKFPLYTKKKDDPTFGKADLIGKTATRITFDD